MFKKCIFYSVLLLMIATLPVMASPIPAVELNTENTSIELSWDVSDVYDKLITVSVADNNNPLSDTNLPDYACIDVNPGNIYNKNIKLSPLMESGIYYVYIDTSSQHHSASLYVMNINSSETKKICEDAYAISDIDNFKDYAKNHILHLGFDTSSEFVSANVDDALSPLFYEMSRHSDKTPLHIYHSSQASIAYAAVKNGYDIEKIIETYGDELHINSSTLSQITDKELKKFKYYISKTDNSCESIEDIVNKTFLLASATGAKDWNTLKDCTLLNSSDLGIETGADSQFSEIPSKKQYKVFVKLYEMLDKVKDFEDFSVKFDSAVKDVLKELGKDNSIKDSSGNSSNKSTGNSTPSKAVVGESFMNQTSPIVKSFTDIEGHFSQNYVNELVALGAVNGYEDNTFRPNNSVTRAEFVAIAQRAFSIISSANSAEFSDVNPTDWYYEAVSAASSNAIVSGYNGLFRPNDYIKREDAAVILANLMNYRNITSHGSSLTYSDSGNISEYAVSAVEKMTSSGIMQGSNGLFRPGDSITRGETAAVIARLLKIQGMVSEVNN